MKKKRVSIYTEFSPNPNAMKFVLDFMLIKNEQVFEFKNKEEAKISPLAESLFDFDYVKGVFFMTNFITINKIESVDWYEIVNKLRVYLKNYLEENKPIFQEGYKPKKVEKMSDSSENEDPLIQKINDLLNEYVRPAVEGDGGTIDFNHFDSNTGILKVNLKGSCSGCPSASLTLKSGIESLMKRFIPEVKEVVANQI